MIVKILLQLTHLNLNCSSVISANVGLVSHCNRSLQWRELICNTIISYNTTQYIKYLSSIYRVRLYKIVWGR